MQPLYLALYWHQHQPYYPDDVSGETLLPWVRLHGVKDYWGMAAHLEAFAEVRCTINLVPSLIVQLLAYVERGAEDRHLRICRLAADDLSREDALWLLDHGFMANRDHMIRPFPRYAELLELRSPETIDAQRALGRFKTRDLRDLQVWSNLAWMHPLAFESDRELAELRRKGCGYTEQEKHWILDKQLDLLAQVIGKHAGLQQRGQIELTTSPFFHPIVPLLYDKALAREAMPDLPLPRHRDGYPEDVSWHLSEAVRLHQRVFQAPPVGLWPSEGSVCEAMIPKLAELGIRWMGTDEEILSQSLGGRVGRDQRGFVRRPELLYRPWLATQGQAAVAVIFRDHALSDLIGFDYQRQDAKTAALDFIGKLKAIAKAVKGAQPPLVSVILDGENCWEYYPNGGVEFLRCLYGSLAQSEQIRTTRVRDYLEQYPAAERLPRLFAGSWINHNFAIWIGHDEDRRAWDLLHQTRQFLKRRSAQGGVAAEQVQRAWRELYIAEGSDWFWWYGEDHNSAQDALFDYLFRKHLQNVYTLLGQKVPAELLEPIARGPAPLIHSQPRGLLDVRVDGKYSYFEWIDAGHYACLGPRGAMARAAAGRISDLYFGFDPNRLLLRIDCRDPARYALASPVQALRVEFVAPAQVAVNVLRPGVPAPAAQLVRRGRVVRSLPLEVAVGRVVELAVPLGALGLKCGDRVRFFVELIAGPKSLERAPDEGLIDLTVPPADFDQIMWQV